MRSCFAPLVFAAAIFAAPSCAKAPLKPLLTTVPQVSLPRYMGTWYEIARMPHPFQKGCEATEAVYTLRPDGDVDVVNSCHKGAIGGPLSQVQGRARHLESAPPGQLEVSFFRPFWSHYWILALADDYSYAVVGHPNRKYAWILCRSRQMAAPTLTPLIKFLEGAGFDTQALIITPQPSGA